MVDGMVSSTGSIHGRYSRMETLDETNVWMISMCDVEHWQHEGDHLEQELLHQPNAWIASCLQNYFNIKYLKSVIDSAQPN